MNKLGMKIGAGLIGIAILTLVLSLFVPVAMENLMSTIIFATLIGGLISFGLSGIAKILQKNN